MSKKLRSIYLIPLILSFVMLAGCARRDVKVSLPDTAGSGTANTEAVLDDPLSGQEISGFEGSKESETTGEPGSVIDEDGYYYDLESVVLYLDEYGTLPGNFITKKEAEKLGWEGGPVGDYYDGGAIGGSHFGNYEKLLPDGDYKECDIDTEGRGRGAKRLVYSADGKYYYTDDHYETFHEVVINDGTVEVLN